MDDLPPEVWALVYRASNRGPDDWGVHLELCHTLERIDAKTMTHRICPLFRSKAHAEAFKQQHGVWEGTAMQLHFARTTGGTA